MNVVTTSSVSNAVTTRNERSLLCSTRPRARTLRGRSMATPSSVIPSVTGPSVRSWPSLPPRIRRPGQAQDVLGCVVATGIDDRERHLDRLADLVLDTLAAVEVRRRAEDHRPKRRIRAIAELRLLHAQRHDVEVDAPLGRWQRAARPVGPVEQEVGPRAPFGATRPGQVARGRERRQPPQDEALCLRSVGVAMSERPLAEQVLGRVVRLTRRPA